MSRERDEGGAIAIMTALLSVALLVVGAFSVDIGMAYTSRMALQTAADAGALAAAATYAGAAGRSCTDLLGAVPEATARQTAERYLTANRSALTTTATGTFTARCADGTVRVGFDVQGDTATYLGRLAGAGETLTSSAHATAAVEVAPGGDGLRPLGICGADVPASAAPGTVWRTYAPGDGLASAASCPLPPTPGNWWTLDCPGENADDGGNGQAQLYDEISNGCSLPITAVSGQEGLTGTVLGARLRAACPVASSTPPYACLSGDPGQPDAGQVENAWAGLIDSGTTVGLPVFCAPGTCGPTITGTGTSAVFPVQRVVAVTVCGYHFGKQLKKRYSSGIGACAPANADAGALMADDSEKNYLLLVSRTLFASGTTQATGCSLGDAGCDGGLRRVRLVQ
ncbi:pilus assembly protein TadG-related protein [Nocardioides jiangxiensis]|uniref:Pilus assembly protein TadG-related protein n=1 Tax=Nocardioides jiangxiensis TaxID=3064524 RepID=A0ABT9B6S3_9ACTN|nr:pilus assembly protein TadG-related protein [Nocardioides sp. WY-20]MDO7869297.1 pilus assembly protein TadG-related protein [Nocardioides sp. WY-20]